MRVTAQRATTSSTLQQDYVRSKVRADVDNILDSGTDVDPVVYYSGADVPDVRRHATKSGHASIG
ncbi:hypothetical protein GCM10009641_31630 [Mycobacterium cookii]|uniref:Uncharacterized protein n=1 Tax=Nocardioides furvisabuli TaxID=375542 RepID=A0ABP5J9R2_9ACTN